jgi:hypothetical protein
LWAIIPPLDLTGNPADLGLVTSGSHRYPDAAASYPVRDCRNRECEKQRDPDPARPRMRLLMSLAAPAGAAAPAGLAGPRAYAGAL